MKPNDNRKIPSSDAIADDWRITAYVFNQLDPIELEQFENVLRSDASYVDAVEQTRRLAVRLEQDAAVDTADSRLLSSASVTKIAAAMDSSEAADRNASIGNIPIHTSGGQSRLRIVTMLAVAASLAAIGTWGYWNWGDRISDRLVGTPTSALGVEARVESESSADGATSQPAVALEDVHDEPFSMGGEAENSPADRALGTSNQFVEQQKQSDELYSEFSSGDKKSAGTYAQNTNAQNNAKDSRGRESDEDLGFAQPGTPAAGLEASGLQNRLSSTATPGTPNEPMTTPFGTTDAYGAGLNAASGGMGMPAGGEGAASAMGGMGGMGDMGGYPGQAGALQGMAEGFGGAGQPGDTPGPTYRFFEGGALPGSGAEQRGDGYGMGAGGGGVITYATPAIRFGDEEAPSSGMGPGGVVIDRGADGRDRLSQLRRESLSKGLGDRGDAYAPIVDNAFVSVADQPLSTFSIDVDTASYSKIRMMLQQYNQLPPPDAVRIEEMVNYFHYDYAGPEDDEVPFAANMELATCPWNTSHKLARIALKGREMENQQRTVSNLVFLLDVSGSMNEPNKLPLVRRGMEMLIGQLGENDRVAIVVYAGAAGMVLDSTTADNKEQIFAALDRLQAGGSTNGGQGIQLAYQVARDNFVQGGTNRVILCTDGDFNVGTTGTENLVTMVEREAKGGVFLSVLGFGTGNLNDAMLEAISGRGDGNYAFIDTTTEAHKVLVEQLTGTLIAIAKDVKIQIEFNPARVASYRLIGYENRILAAKDFADDTKDAGEIGAGHTVTAFYEIVPAGSARPGFADLKYQPRTEPETAVEVPEQFGDELLTLKLRYKAPEGGASKLLEFPILDADTDFAKASEDFRFASSVAAFGMLLRNSPHRGDANFESVRQQARSALGEDRMGLRAEFLGLIDQAATRR
jgi:Ca-activated chloride channel family protein